MNDYGIVVKQASQPRDFLTQILREETYKIRRHRNINNPDRDVPVG